MTDPHLGRQEKEAVHGVLDSGELTKGEEVSAFESEFASFCETESSIATSSGTTALHTALTSLEIGDGDRVLTTPFTSPRTTNAIRLVGAEPVFADIDIETFNLDPERVATKLRDIDGEIDGILVTHLYGRPANLDELADIASYYDVPLIEDAAQALGSTYRGQPVGSVGDVGCFSFHQSRNMTTGEGGMVVTDRSELAQRAKQFIDHGRQGRHAQRVGHSFRLSEVAAAIGRIQLRRLPAFVDARQQHARQLRNELADSSFVLPESPAWGTHAYQRFTIRSERRDELREHLEEFGIETVICYPQPVHHQPAYEDITASTPVAARAASEVLSVPVHPKLSAKEVNTVVAALEYFDAYL